MTPRRLLLAIALLAAACRPDSKPDPQLPALIEHDAVDDRLSHLVEGERVVVTIAADDPAKGASAPLVTIVEWSDFQCPFCGTFAQMLDELVANYPEDVRVVFKQKPLPMHPNAVTGARAALAAGKQGHFWAMHDRLFGDRSHMTRDDVIGHARALGLDVDAFVAAFDDPATAARVEDDERAGAMLGVRGTPSCFINGIAFSGAPKPEVLAQIIERERAAAQKLIDAGSARAEVHARIMKAAAGQAKAPARAF